MSTLNQLVKKFNRDIRKKTRSRTPILRGPQRRGYCKRVYKMAPKKPCSARRSVAWIMFTYKAKDIYNEKNFRGSLCSVRGETHNLRTFSRVLIQGGRIKDLPGVKYKVVRSSKPATSDLTGLYRRCNARSRYGTINSRIVKRLRAYRKFREDKELLMELEFMIKSDQINKKIQKLRGWGYQR